MTDERAMRFRNADLDVEFFDHGDGKVRALIRTTRDEALLARLHVAYLATVAASWKAGERVRMQDVAPAWLSGLKDLADLLAEVDLLDAEGLIPEASWTRRFEPARDRVLAKLERDRRAQRDHRSRLRTVSADSALTHPPVSAESLDVSDRTVTATDSETVETRETASALSLVGARGLPKLDKAAIAALQERTGEPWSRAGDRALGQYDRLVEVHGLPAVVAAFDRIAGGKRKAAEQLIFGARNALEPIPSARELRQDDVDDDSRKRSERVQEEMRQRRVEMPLHSPRVNGAARSESLEVAPV